MNKQEKINAIMDFMNDLCLLLGKMAEDAESEAMRNHYWCMQDVAADLMLYVINDIKKGGAE